MMVGFFRILDCEEKVLLLSNDVNLRNKAWTMKIKAFPSEVILLLKFISR